MTLRHWLDWSSPCLPAAAKWIVDRAGSVRGVCDLESAFCLTPGRRAGRQLLHMLAEQCEQRGWHLAPPRMLTPGVLVEVFLSRPPNAASREEISLAWVRALRECDREVIRPLLPIPPEVDEFESWHALAQTIGRLHEELAGERLVFRDVIERAERTETMFAEIERYSALERLQLLYLEVLESCGLVDPHVSREQTLRAGIEPDLQFGELFSIGVIDLNAQQRAVMQSGADHVVALIHAPETEAEKFDELGCLIQDAWSEQHIEIKDDIIEVCDRPADQVQATLRIIDRQSDGYEAAQITIGTGDEDLVPSLQRAGRWAGLSMHAASGYSLSSSPPCLLLQAIADWLGEGRFADLASLVRHCDLERWLMARLEAKGLQPGKGIEGWVSLLDEYFSKHLQQHPTGAWLGKPEMRQSLGAVHDEIEMLLAPLDQGTRKLGDWAEPILGILREVYEAFDGAGDDRATTVTAEACLALRDLLADFASVHESLQPTVSGVEAIEHLLAAAEEGRSIPETQANQIEMLGWLELHLDAAPMLIVTGVNDGSIPLSVQNDPFLPDSLRKGLGLMNNNRRYARDAYLLQAIINSREEVRLITGRRSQDGDPLVPSRLLMAGDEETIKRRVEWFCSDVKLEIAPLPRGLPAPAAESQFVVPTLTKDIPQPVKMSVTDFAQYIRCPYRYALSRLLGLESIDDADTELDAMQFGSLAHDVLEAFGKDESIRDSADPQAISSFLFARLDEIIQEKYGTSPPPALRVQAARLRQRLVGFAQCQAILRTEGWQIMHCEVKYTDANELDIPGGDPMPVVGKIDRIDYHEASGRWRIIDYKTTESGTSPNQKHLGFTRDPKEDQVLDWQDLQLPLYHYLARQHEIVGEVELAYLVLPKKADGVKVTVANWSQEQIEEAIEKAREIVKDIRAGSFEMNDIDARFDDFARICQTTTYQGVETEGEEVLGGSS